MINLRKIRHWPRKQQRRWHAAICRIIERRCWQAITATLDRKPLHVYNVTWESEPEPCLFLARMIQGTFTVKSSLRSPEASRT